MYDSGADCAYFNTIFLIDQNTTITKSKLNTILSYVKDKIKIYSSKKRKEYELYYSQDDFFLDELYIDNSTLSKIIDNALKNFGLIAIELVCEHVYVKSHRLDQKIINAGFCIYHDYDNYEYDEYKLSVEVYAEFSTYAENFAYELKDFFMVEKKMLNFFEPSEDGYRGGGFSEVYKYILDAEETLKNKISKFSSLFIDGEIKEVPNFELSFKALEVACSIINEEY